MGEDLSMSDIGSKGINRAEDQELKADALKLDYVKEIIEFNAESITALEDTIHVLAEQHQNDVRFQRFVVNYLNLMLKFLDSPIIIDKFGDTPDGHVRRRETISAEALAHPRLFDYLEGQKVSRNRLGTVLELFSENIVGTLYPPSSTSDMAEMEQLAVEATPLLNEVKEKLNRETITPLEEKIDLVHRTEKFVERGIKSLVGIYEK